MLDKISKIAGHYTKSIEKNTILFLNTILQSRTVNIYQQKDYVNNILHYDKPDILKKPKPSSNYLRLIRFINKYSSSNLWQDILKIVLSLLEYESNILYLDATKWEIGDFPIHVLVLGVRCKGVCIPIYWETYEHKGVLSEKERILFMVRAQNFVDLKDKILLCDREFIGLEWFNYLTDKHIKFVIRLRYKAYYSFFLNSNDYFRLIEKAKKEGYSCCEIKIGTKKYKIEFWRNKNEICEKDEEVIFFITNVLNQTPMGRYYPLRWQMENCFKHLKSNGFHLEDLNIKDVLKTRFIVSFLVLSYTFCILEGKIIIDEREEEEKKIKKTYKKNNQEKKYLIVSIFREGLSEMIFLSRNIYYFSIFLKKIKLII